MSFVFFIAFIVVVVVLQTAFAHIRSSTSVQEQANADFIEGLQFHKESILAQIPKPVASTETKEARIATLKLAGVKEISVESFANGAGNFYTSGFAYNVTSNTKGCKPKGELGSIQYVFGQALGTCIPAGDNSMAMSCNVDGKKIEYAYNYWFGSANCQNFEAPPVYTASQGQGNTCNVNSQKFGVYSGCGEGTNYLRPAVTASDSSIMLARFGSTEDCNDFNKPLQVTAYPLNGCMASTDRKGKVIGSTSYTDCTQAGSISAKSFKSPDCKGKFQTVTLASDIVFGASPQCNAIAGSTITSKFICNKPMTM